VRHEATRQVVPRDASRTWLLVVRRRCGCVSGLFIVWRLSGCAATHAKLCSSGIENFQMRGAEEILSPGIERGPRQQAWGFASRWYGLLRRPADPDIVGQHGRIANRAFVAELARQGLSISSPLFARTDPTESLSSGPTDESRGGWDRGCLQYGFPAPVRLHFQCLLASGFALLAPMACDSYWRLAIHHGQGVFGSTEPVDTAAGHQQAPALVR